MNVLIDARLLSPPTRGIASYLANCIKFNSEYDRLNKYYDFQYENISKENNFYKYISIKENLLQSQFFEKKLNKLHFSKINSTKVYRYIFTS